MKGVKKKRARSAAAKNAIDATIVTASTRETPRPTKNAEPVEPTNINAQEWTVDKYLQAQDPATSCFEHKSKARRMSVAYIFEEVFHANPDESEWSKI